MSALAIIGGTTAFLAGLGALEGIQHRKALAKLKIRVHVNGTRGKSSVTRLIAAGLREGGIVTCAKTTGTLARMILPNGREYPVYRPSRANVIEQLRIVRAAVEVGAEALVIECMAVQPGLQALCEWKFVRATHGVITNARADHLDVMGPGETDVALALAATTPIGGVLYTAEQRHLDVFRMSVKDRKSALVPVELDEIDSVTQDDLRGFSYIEHAENVALALKVCGDLGVSREVALRGMWKAKPDPGVLAAYELSFFGRRIVFVNAFAANDPESTERIFRMVTKRFPDVERTVLLVNCRADRPDRSRQLGEACLSWGEADHYLLIGTGTYIFAKPAMERGLDPGRVTYAEDTRIEEIFEMIVDRAGESALIIGIANIGGQGLDLVRYFKNRSKQVRTEV
jgi:poly-gamma-glutamate synthase PgsB/CapB